MVVQVGDWSVYGVSMRVPPSTITLGVCVISAVHCEICVKCTCSLGASEGGHVSGPVPFPPVQSDPRHPIKGGSHAAFVRACMGSLRVHG